MSLLQFFRQFCRKMNEKQFVLLDGGTATELVRLGHDDIEMHPLWSSVLLQRDQDSILQVHKNFLSVGSDIILTVSYQATVNGFKQHAGLSEREAVHLIKHSVNLAKEARGKYNPNAKVAGSLGPVGVQFADGSEYTGNYVDGMTEEEMKTRHRPQIEALLDAGVDYIAFETQPAVKEAKAIVELLESEFPQSKAWLTYSCKSGSETCHGGTFYEAVKALYQSKNIVGVGVNCTNPNYVTPLLKSIRNLHINKSIIVKPNSGEIWDDETDKWVGEESCVDISTKVEEWIENGATWFGGCCRVYPDTIAKMRWKLNEMEKSVS